ncbi:adenylosuccinate lyase [Bacteriovorax sp. DB6_IX]|uniref:adenylosuccinate lyase n=1 Tax=Bacteriovorax sp. DB6_IX TaxID=1353530 RepID=UPI00038A36F4|nr:adenylosuccinate lyase [Bacteriovorax sp. DB6_IX]EQC51621.1 adenylosuccinate lyase [Bacteriovorax sp. DB6_IX]
MIPRYERKEISEIWSEKRRAEYYLEVELALLHALESQEIIPKNTLKNFENVSVDTSRIGEIEAEVKHDIIAFCTSITEQVDTQFSKFFHFGVTSSDIIDTAQSLQIKASLKIILNTFSNLNNSLFNLSQRTLHIIGVGRSHGMYAEALSYGQKFLGFYAEFRRRFDELEDYYNHEITGQLSGAVGNYTVINPEVEREALSKLGLEIEPLSTQVIPRDRIAKLSTILASIAGAIERISVEIRHLHRSEVGEVFEGFSKGQKGSSTMPHKKNPISTENLTGVARIIRSHAIVALENNILWHERDISHSSAERLFLPDSLGLIQYALKRLTSTLDNLVICEERIEQRSENSPGVLSSFYLHQLIKNAPLRREEIYSIIQQAAFENAKSNIEFDVLINEILEKMNYDLRVAKVNMKELKDKYRETAKTMMERVISTYPLK